MHYKGTPLVERNRIDEAELKSYSSFFKQEETSLPFSEKIFESINNQKIDLVVYFNSKWNNKELTKYHKEHYGIIPYFSQEMVSERTIKTVIVKEGVITGYIINHHDNDWRETVEQSYDAELKLIEYREFFYDSSSDSIIKENIFYAPNWHVSKESYS